MLPSNYHLGLPAWAFPGWSNVYFDAAQSALTGYASVFNTVEGNTTFYHIPDDRTIDQWGQAVAGTGFRFCFKLPKTVTHERVTNQRDLEVFLRRIEPLKDNLGPLLLQFPSTVTPTDLLRVGALLQSLPDYLRCAIEVRHPDFFSQPETLEPLLEKYNAGRVMMDTRPVFQGDRNHPEVLAALHKKPDLPVPGKVYNGLMMVRLLLHPDLVSNDNYIEQWVQRTATALLAGCQCFMMIHCPNNQHCPALALQFHERLRHVLHSKDSNINLPALPVWPAPQQETLL